MLKKIIYLLIIFLILNLVAQSQVVDLIEKIPVITNGIEYGYIIKNEQTKAAGKEEFARFEIRLFATNKSGCTRLYSDKTALFGSSTTNGLATFNCLNANGKRLTAKGGEVQVRTFYVTVKYQGKDYQGKNITTETKSKAGYIFKNGETIQNDIIVLVPLNERPLFKCTPNYLPEME